MLIAQVNSIDTGAPLAAGTPVGATAGSPGGVADGAGAADGACAMGGATGASDDGECRYNSRIAKFDVLLIFAAPPAVAGPSTTAAPAAGTTGTAAPASTTTPTTTGSTK